MHSIGTGVELPEPFPGFDFIQIADGLADLAPSIGASGLDDSAFQNILQYVVSVHGVATIIIEHNYIDVDYLDEFAEFYSRSLHSYSAKCWRLHFLRAVITKEKFLTLRKTGSQEFERNYVGYAVIRPTHKNRVGRTVLVPPTSSESGHFVLCKGKYPVNLAGHQLSVLGFPFMQQDANVGSCGTAALWMAVRAINMRYTHSRVFTPAQITMAATRYTIPTGRPMPSQGLHPAQISNAIGEMDLAPLLYGWPLDCSTTESGKPTALQQVYYYMESEIPVIACLKKPNERARHAIVICGHTSKPLPEPAPCPADFVRDDSGKVVLDIYSASSWVDCFIVNDDRTGPYFRFKLTSPPQKVGSPSTKEQSSANCATEFKAPVSSVAVHYDLMEWELEGVVIPCLPEIRMEGSRAERIGKQHLTRLLSLPSTTKRPRVPDDGAAVFRTYCIPSNDYKHCLKSRELPVAIVEYLCGTPMSRFVWVIEMCRLSEMKSANPVKRRVFGEIVIDATSAGDQVIASYINGQFLRLQQSNATREPRLTGELLLAALENSVTELPERDYLCMSEEVCPH